MFTIFGIVLIGLAVPAAVLLALQVVDQQRQIRHLQENHADLLRRLSRQSEGENVIREQADWNRALFEKTADIVLVFEIGKDGSPGTFVEANDAACAALGYTRDELLGMSPMDIEEHQVPTGLPGYSMSDLLVLPDHRIQSQGTKLAQAPARQFVERLLRERRVQVERIFRDKRGRTFPVEVDARLLDRFGHKAAVCSVHDITERQKAQSALLESQQRFRDFFSQSPIGVALYDSERTLVDVNRACLRMFGMPDNREFGRFNQFDNPFIPAPLREKIALGENVAYECVVDFADVVRVLHCATGRTGKAHFDILLTALERGPGYRPRGYILQVQDITERRKAETELRRREQQLQQAEKMEALGSMAGGIAHDFNNMLTPILGYSEMILRKVSEDDMSHKLAQGIYKAGNRAKDMVNQILSFSRKTEGPEEQEMKPMRVAPIVKEVLALQRTALPETVELRRVVKTDRDIVIANPTKIHEVLMNLCTNAGHAMREKGGMLEVLLTDFVITGRDKTRFPDLKPGPYLRVSISDTGSGMDADVAAKVFEPFFTTKKAGEGTGMGLPVCKRIVESCFGAITFETEKGKGTVFHVVLPIAEAHALEQVAETLKPLAAGTERILVVDDDPDVLEMIASMLTTMGYRPSSANHGTAALRIFTMEPDYFDLVILDQVMPGITGVELARQIRAVRPNIPVVLCTAFNDSLSMEEVKASGIQDLVLKPIVMDQLSRTIRQALARQAAPFPTQVVTAPGPDAAPSLPA